jgi:hypothetical protein
VKMLRAMITTTGSTSDVDRVGVSLYFLKTTKFTIKVNTSYND